MQILNQKYIETEIGVKISCDVVSDLKIPSTLWFDISAPGLLIKDLNQNLNWALVALLVPAMTNGVDISIDGKISKQLLFNINNSLQSFLNAFEPALNIVGVNSSEQTNLEFDRQKDFTGTGMSAGVDSFATIIENYQNPDSPYNVTHTCIFNVGAFAKLSKPGVRDFFLMSSERSKVFSEKNGLVPIAIDSNIDDFYDGSFALSHTLRNISAAMLFDGYFKRYLYSSGYSSKIILKTEPSHDVAFLDPVILPLLALENMQFISAVSYLSRYEKIALVSKSNSARTILDCCAAPLSKRLELGFVNCNKCKKCQRSIIAFDTMGKLDLFSKVFDLDFYAKNKRKFHGELFARSYAGNQRDTEIIEEGRKKSYVFTPSYSSLLKYYFHGILIENLKRKFFRNASSLKIKFRSRKKNVY